MSQEKSLKNKPVATQCRGWAWLRGSLVSVLMVFGVAVLTTACSPGNSVQRLSPEAALGEKAFNDLSLSASGRQSCASCHSAVVGHAAPNALAAQLGGADLSLQGVRSSGSLRYLATNKAFHFDAEGTPKGGFFWDGRADSLAIQAAGPLLRDIEMANPDKASVVRKIANATWVADFKSVYGVDVLNDVDSAFDKLTQALQRYQLEDKVFQSFSSKYDAVLRKKATLSAPEARGLALFNDAAKGNCASCHTSEKSANGDHPLFTDFTYDNLGVPRNAEIAANSKPTYFDLGLCGRVDLKARGDLCGAFKVPSLRNVALRPVFFHNGKFKTLKDALVFYVQRDTHPEKWYPANPDGSIKKFDDVPLKYRVNVNTKEVPYDRQPGDAPALNDAEIEDVIAFLKTLNDGWTAR
jgi:cytochrome c peroxidase